jgi:hypothetical protein
MPFVTHAQGPISIELSRVADGAGDFHANARFVGQLNILPGTAVTGASQVAAITACITALTTLFPQSDADEAGSPVDLMAIGPISIVNAGVSGSNWTT